MNQLPKADEEPSPELTNSIGMRLKLIPAGDFLMGSKETKEDLKGMGISLYDSFDNDDEQPQHRVAAGVQALAAWFDTAPHAEQVSQLLAVT